MKPIRNHYARLPDGHSRTARLPLGYVATFMMRSNGIMLFQWAPARPTIRCKRKRDRLWSAYIRERDEFLAEVAMLAGVAMGVTDTGGSEDGTGGTPAAPDIARARKSG